MALRGVIPALTTPFQGATFSAKRLLANIDRYRSAGVHGYLLLGSTGEAPLLDLHERIDLLRAARQAIPPDRPMLAGAGAESTAGAVANCRVAADCGAGAALVLTPHYYGPQMSEEALIGHFARVADASPIPVLLYDVPKFTHLSLPVEVVAELSEHGNIAGIKDSGGDLGRLKRLVESTAETFDVVCGSHRIFVEGLVAGARAAILAAASVLPEVYVQLYDMAREGRQEDARQLLQEVTTASDLAVTDYGVPGIKAAMDLRGLAGGSPRLPLLPAGQAARDKLGRELNRLERSGLLLRGEA